MKRITFEISGFLFVWLVYFVVNAFMTGLSKPEI
jgi:hypothetical protein